MSAIENQTPAIGQIGSRRHLRDRRGAIDRLREFLLLRGAVVADRNVTEDDPEPLHQLGVRVVIRRDERDVAGELPELTAHKEVGEAVALTRHHDRDARPRREVVDLPIHCEARRDRFERAAKIG